MPGDFLPSHGIFFNGLNKALSPYLTIIHNRLHPYLGPGVVFLSIRFWFGSLDRSVRPDASAVLMLFLAVDYGLLHYCSRVRSDRCALECDVHELIASIFFIFFEVYIPPVRNSSIEIFYTKLEAIEARTMLDDEGRA